MPTDFIVLAAITTAFAIFGVTLFCTDLYARRR